MDLSTEERFAILELKIMEQEQMLHEMSDIVNKQWQDIERVHAKLNIAQDRLISLEDSIPSSGGSERPPHY